MTQFNNILFKIANNSPKGCKQAPRCIRLKTLAQSMACLLSVLGLAIGSLAIEGMAAQAQSLRENPTGANKQLLPRRKFYQGFEADPDYCDTKNIRGWFYWYVDSSGRCTIVIVANREEAIRQSRELFENSFSVMVAGFGVKN